MKTIIMMIVALATTQALASDMSFLNMPSNSDYEALEQTANNIALNRAQNYATSKGHSLDQLVAVNGNGMVAKYRATAGQCSFTVSVGLFFVSKVSNAKNCN